MSNKSEKIHSKDEFELCYLRHQYLRKITVVPTEGEMRPYESIAIHFGKNTYFMYRSLFGAIGMECDDVINIAKTHITSYVGLFSLENNQRVMDEYYNVFRKRFGGEAPGQWDIDNKNRANFTFFLKQRMEDLVRVCRQKARNVKGLQTDEYLVFRGMAEPPKRLMDLAKNHEKFGYRKVDLAVFKSIKRRAKLPDGSIFKVGDEYYVIVPVEHRNLSINDFTSAGLDPYDSIHNMTPEQVFASNEWEDRKKAFESTPLRSKIRVIKSFVAKNHANPEFAEEIRAAKKMLKEMGKALAV